jgi:glutamine---fructose-6-phosphate transaminase (isomerizing)
MCGVIGLRCEKDRKDLGEVSSKLLCMLEYRGYDSSGAIIQNEHGDIVLKKDVGAPSVVTKELGINKLHGKIFCGQVRWATFGMVTKENAQPHEVKCKTHLYGAHNGNITNCDQLKVWLSSEGHKVLSDNDGEMLVHTVEHYFAIELSKIKDSNIQTRWEALKNAIVLASKKINGSFAAVVVDPVTETMACIKAGSSLYMGQGKDPVNGSFIIASSDLASVLSLTKILIPINEDEFSIFTNEQYVMYQLKTGEAIERKPVRSKLKIEETKLSDSFKFFMEQEIYSQSDTVAKLISVYLDGVQLGVPASLDKFVRDKINELASSTDWDGLRDKCTKLFSTKEFAELTSLAKKLSIKTKNDFASALSGFLDEISNMNISDQATLSLIDSMFVAEESLDAKERAEKFVELICKTKKKGNSVYCVACGTSFNSAKTGAVFFDAVAGIHIEAMLPGDFRSQVMNSVREGDLIVGISQSGETKDLVDILNQIKDSGVKTVNAIIVNNVNSTLALEKSDVYIPLFCGAEVAVPATKSFMNQMALLYILAIMTGERLGKDVSEHKNKVRKIPELISSSFNISKKDIDAVSENLYLEPSIHILATGMYGIAREGALKVREVVLNHTEGYEATEFKHGPNTILGINTVFGIHSVRALLKKFSDALSNVDSSSFTKLYKAVSDYAFADIEPKGLNEEERKMFDVIFKDHNFFDTLYSNYPLVFITGPSERDVNLTISQINTHKIRGANIYVIAEENKLLNDACTKAVVVRKGVEYKSGYIKLPKTGDSLLTFFSSTVALQLLALNMSIKKAAFLDRIEILEHGVHPDSPKNVSKSITVD